MTNNKTVKQIIKEEITSTPYQNTLLDIGNFISANASELGKKYNREIHANGKIDVFKFIAQQYFRKTGISPEAIQ